MTDTQVQSLGWRRLKLLLRTTAYGLAAIALALMLPIIVLGPTTGGLVAMHLGFSLPFIAAAAGMFAYVKSELDRPYTDTFDTMLAFGVGVVFVVCALIFIACAAFAVFGIITW